MPGPRTHIRWTTAHDQQLLRMYDIEQRSFVDIAPILERSAIACQQRYYLLKKAREGSFVYWTDKLDGHIIDGKRRGLSSTAIALEMASLSMSARAISDRWFHLQQLDQVPEDVLVIHRRKHSVEWNAEEDEIVAKMWISGIGDAKIAGEVGLEGRCQEDVRIRRIELVKGGGGGVYKRLLGVESKEMTGLEKAVGKGKYGWMK
ncbi:hypothetical protein HBI56_189940 [Parastagonospora nodorum]|uniref:Myb-like domain-containing protein n=2 Tax=Phaeosphaeria nodorum (strain SN15 / ATCC MYA-4574 / FGSC 10173) TaxID=321614 RepID=A0A7U2F9V9_PHANO|nr:hypothetical protein SNOG_12068 [Parastagonospora nodorum SN15]KAH3910661.1 hypothetical protein HBH56_144520 [Parastagonospora nodorum]EAT80480.2 hypothetical protein SNOG_12068 [Parastagonospora nodorum SN15]KAH3927859.1 hypothetical protein HBH54_149710 [Parastagonospora nodorum]KAH3948064.1 hypothetical protein HBH53_109750 [Parastagonospora nodorum]KAH3960122.1 hypothetical protein HBH51_193570 [Parastagonospora nodorum]